MLYVFCRWNPGNKTRQSSSSHRRWASIWYGNIRESVVMVSLHIKGWVHQPFGVDLIGNTEISVSLRRWAHLWRWSTLVLRWGKFYLCWPEYCRLRYPEPWLNFERSTLGERCWKFYLWDWLSYQCILVIISYVRSDVRRIGIFGNSGNPAGPLGNRTPVKAR